MIKVLKEWFHHYFSDPQAVFIAASLLIFFTILMTMSTMLAPLLVSLVIAYLLDGVIKSLQQWHFPRVLAVFLVYATFMTLLIFIVVVVLPLIEYQLTQLIQEIPSMVSQAYKFLKELPENYPIISDKQVDGLIESIRGKVNELSKTILPHTST